LQNIVPKALFFCAVYFASARRLVPHNLAQLTKIL
jgi:hypothetical protein